MQGYSPKLPTDRIRLPGWNRRSGFFSMGVKRQRRKFAVVQRHYGAVPVCPGPAETGLPLAQPAMVKNTDHRSHS